MSDPGPTDRPPPAPGGVEAPERPDPGGTAPVVVVLDERRPPAQPAVEPRRWAPLAAAALAAEGAPAGSEMNLLLVDEDAMASLNEEHLGGSGPTDVLSFPLDLVGLVDLVAAAPDPANPADPAEAPVPADGAPVLAGDVVLCPAVAARQAPDHAGSFDDEMALLVVHGVLHLLGHDHAEPGERARMQARERDLLARFHGPLARDPWAAS